jgi:hypothetical protein
MGKKSRARRERRRKKNVFGKFEGDKLEQQSKTKAGKMVLEDADEEDVILIFPADFFSEEDDPEFSMQGRRALWF